MSRLLCAVVASVLLLAATASSAEPGFGWRCPASLAGGGASLPLVARHGGVWRVDEAVPFVSGRGRFWRFVCTYGRGGAVELEAVVEWVDRPHEDGRLILDGICDEEAGSPEVVASGDRQVRARATAVAGPPPLDLAREMLAAATAVALPCPGSGTVRICPLWEVVEDDGGRDGLCRFRQGAENPEPGDEHRWIYWTECRYGGFIIEGPARRLAPGRIERSFTTTSGGTARTLYDGPFEAGGEIAGTFHRISSDGERGRDQPFTARCLEE